MGREAGFHNTGWLWVIGFPAAHCVKKGPGTSKSHEFRPKTTQNRGCHLNFVDFGGII